MDYRTYQIKYEDGVFWVYDGPLPESDFETIQDAKDYINYLCGDKYD